MSGVQAHVAAGSAFVPSPELQQLYPGFDHRLVPVADGVEIACSVGGKGPALLMLHGHPQTRALWHRVAAVLSRDFTLVISDLRGYGDSSKPMATSPELYSKRVMAQDQRSLMAALGFERFQVLAHDRGARVAHRLAADHPEAVERLVTLDIAPTLAMYRQANETFARAYWHWFFLIQPAPMPERLIEANPGAYLREVMGRRSAGLAPFDPRALAEYQRCLEKEGTARGICEDYRASAGIDLQQDQADRDEGCRLTMPLLVLWGAQGVVQRCFKPLDEWRQVATDVRGQALDCGHYIAEEAPELLLAQLEGFLRR